MRYFPERRATRLLGLAGLRSGIVQRALDIARRLVPGFDPFQTEYPAGGNPTTECVYRQGRAVASPFAEASSGLLDNRFRRLAADVIGIRHSYVCPLVGHGTVLGNVTFLTRESPSPQERRVCDAFARQATLTLENASLAAARRASEERLRLALASGGMGLWEWDVDADRLTWHGWEGEPGTPPLPPTAPLAQILDVFHPDDRERARQDFDRAASDGGLLVTELRTVLPDAAPRWLLLRGQLAPGDGAEHGGRLPRRMLGVAADISAQKNASLEREARLRMDGAMLVARTVAHQINNALVPMGGFAELLTLRPAVRADPQADAYARSIVNGTQEMAAQVRRLQRIVRLEEDSSVLGPDRPVLDINRSVTPS
jgi:PAS domain-containing protein